MPWRPISRCKRRLCVLLLPGHDMAYPAGPSMMRIRPNIPTKKLSPEQFRRMRRPRHPDCTNLHVSRRRSRIPRICETNQLARKAFGRCRTGAVFTCSLLRGNMRAKSHAVPFSASDAKTNAHGLTGIKCASMPKEWKLITIFPMFANHESSPS